MKSSFILLFIVMLLLVELLVMQETFAEESDQLEWKKEQIIGKYHNDESKRDDIFLIQYKSTTGNVSFSTLGSDDFFDGFMVEYTTPYLSSQADNLEIKIPRNYPYTNVAVALGEIIVWVNGQEYSDIHSMTDCFLHFSIPISGNSKIELAPTNYLTSIPFIGETIPNHCLVKTILLSPKQQMANDIPLNEVICKEGLEIIIKATTKAPACVKPSTAEKLIERGWGIQ